MKELTWALLGVYLWLEPVRIYVAAGEKPMVWVMGIKWELSGGRKKKRKKNGSGKAALELVKRARIERVRVEATLTDAAEAAVAYGGMCALEGLGRAVWPGADIGFVCRVGEKAGLSAEGIFSLTVGQIIVQAALWTAARAKRRIWTWKSIPSKA